MNEKKNIFDDPFNINDPLFNIKESYLYLLLICSTIIISLIIFRQFIFDQYVYFFKDIGSDNVNIALPNFFENQYLKKEGFSKFWSFYSGLGQAKSNPYNFFPYIWLNRIFITIFGNDYFFYRIYSIIFLYILPAGIFTFWYFRTLKISKLASFLAALLFEFSGYMIIGSQWWHAFKILYFIILLTAFEQFLIKKKWFLIPISYFLMSNNSFSLATHTVFLLLYGTIRYYDENNKLNGIVKFWFKFALYAFLGVFMNISMAVSNFLNMFNSPRVSGDVNQAKILLNHPETIDAYLRNVTTILRFFSNDIFGSGSNYKGWYNYLEGAIFYIGLLPLMLFPLAFSKWQNKKKYAYLLLLIFWLIVAFVPIVRHFVNFLTGNYYKNTIDIYVPFIILFFGITAFDQIIKTKKTNQLSLIITTGILLVLLFFPYFKLTNAVINFGMKLIIALFIVTYLMLIFFYIDKHKKSFLLSIIIIATVELIFTDSSSVNDREKYTITEFKTNLAGYNDGTFEALNFIRKQDTSLFYRIEKDYSSGNSQHSSLNDAKVQGYYGTPTYGSFNQVNYIKFLEATEIIHKGNEGQTRWCTGVRGIPLLMEFVSVKYFLSKQPNTLIKYNGYDSIATINGIKIFRNKYFLPLGFTYNKFLPFEEFRKLSKFKKQVALLSAVITDKNFNTIGLQKLDTNSLPSAKQFNLNIYKKIIDSLRQSTLTISSFKDWDIKGSISIKNNTSVLFFTIPYDKSWTIYINGKKFPPQKFNIGFMGIKLKRGKYNIELRYRPPMFIELLIIELLAIAIYIFLLLKTAKKQTKTQVP